MVEKSVSTLTQAEYKILPTARNQSDVRSQVSSALTRGYLYAATAAASISIFGSLGVVTAGFKKLVACFSFGDIEGAKILGIWDSSRKEEILTFG